AAVPPRRREARSKKGSSSEKKMQGNFSDRICRFFGGAASCRTSVEKSLARSSLRPQRTFRGDTLSGVRHLAALFQTRKSFPQRVFRQDSQDGPDFSEVRHLAALLCDGPGKPD
ncbi:MAG: hypothetical protein IJS32_06655, partial [Kiritimatiellae bacterium]|nr:hypothetical protein [Kiritimatiellia bacterium]